MEKETLIKVESVKKKYCRSVKRSMLYGVSDIAKDIIGINGNSNKLRKDEFWSLNNISFEINRGECLGVIGANGAGKSTLLKLLNGIILLDDGRITTKGKVGALIEVGSGFHPMLSGRENVYINGSILGMSKKEIDHNLDSIISFAELEGSIDMPVKHYSSGMYVRLGFAIAAHIRPDILILDEILAVGDMAFRAKCFKHLASIKKESTIILVSHDMRNISRICDRALFLEDGNQICIGSPEKTINYYRKTMSTDSKTGVGYNTGIIEIKNVRVNKVIKQYENAEIEIQLSLKEKTNLIANLAIHREDGTHCCGIMSEPYIVEEVQSDMFVVTITLKKLLLMPGSYNITVAFWDEYKIGLLAVINDVGKFVVTGTENTHGVYMPEHEWHIQQQ